MRLLVCGTRMPKKYRNAYKQTVYDYIAQNYSVGETTIVEGCCKDSADEFAEEFAKENGYDIKHFPSTSGNYLRRNVEMVNECDEVIAFWDGWSYGTAHTIARALLSGIPVEIIQI